MTLVEFLLARLSWEERLARAAAGDFPEWVDSSEETIDGDNVYFTVRAKHGRTWEPDYFLSVREDRRDADRVTHISMWDPARVIADVEMKRLIIENFLRIPAGERGYGAARYALRCLALPYAKHPHYQEEWKP